MHGSPELVRRCGAAAIVTARRFLPVTLFLALGAAPARADLDSLLAATPADSLVAPLRRIEADRSRPEEGIRAAMTLGQLHLARGEYHEAAGDFARAAARLDPERKDEARYWQGIAWLGLKQAAPARSALEEVARGNSPRRALAALGVAQAWELADQPRRAFETVTALLESGAGRAEPAALERYVALADRLGHPDQARRARERLLRTYPRSMEAASARLADAPEAPGAGAFSVVIGSFVDKARARGLASEAKRAGFPQAQVVTRGTGLAAVHAVRLGVYPDRRGAAAAADQAARALGVEPKVVKGS